MMTHMTSPGALTSATPCIGVLAPVLGPPTGTTNMPKLVKRPSITHRCYRMILSKWNCTYFVTACLLFLTISCNVRLHPCLVVHITHLHDTDSIISIYISLHNTAVVRGLALCLGRGMSCIYSQQAYTVFSDLSYK